MIWTLGTNPTYPYETGYNGYGIYPTEAAYLQKPPGAYQKPSVGLPNVVKYLETYGEAFCQPVAPC